VEMPHGAVAKLGSRELTFFDTPGHARHCASIRDSRTAHVFTGDTFGLSYRELDDGDRQYVFPSTSPVQFDPEAYHRSIDLIAGLKPQAVYATHYGRLRDIPRLAGDLHRLVDAHVRVAESCRGAGYDCMKEGVTALLLEEAGRQGWKLPREKVIEVWEADLDFNAQGLEFWSKANRAR